MSKKHHKKNNLIYIGLIILAIIIVLGFFIIYKQNSQVIDKYSTNPNMPKIHSRELTDLIRMQQSNGMDKILKVDCDTLQNSGAIQYCKNQSKQVNKILGNE